MAVLRIPFQIVVKNCETAFHTDVQVACTPAHTERKGPVMLFQIEVAVDRMVFQMLVKNEDTPLHTAFQVDDTPFQIEPNSPEIAPQIVDASVRIRCHVVEKKSRTAPHTRDHNCPKPSTLTPKPEISWVAAPMGLVRIVKALGNSWRVAMIGASTSSSRV